MSFFLYSRTFVGITLRWCDENERQALSSWLPQSRHESHHTRDEIVSQRLSCFLYELFFEEIFIYPCQLQKQYLKLFSVSLLNASFIAFARKTTWSITTDVDNVGESEENIFISKIETEKFSQLRAARKLSSNEPWKFHLFSMKIQRESLWKFWLEKSNFTRKIFALWNRCKKGK